MFLHDLIVQSCYFSLPSLEVCWRTNCPVEAELTHTDSVEKQPAPVFLADGDLHISNLVVWNIMLLCKLYSTERK